MIAATRPITVFVIRRHMQGVSGFSVVRNFFYTRDVAEEQLAMLPKEPLLTYEIVEAICHEDLPP